MRRPIFREWLERFNAYHRSCNQHALLLLDNARPHKVEDLTLSHVRVVFFTPNLTSVIQPLDQGVIAAFKRRYCRRLIQFLLNQALTNSEICAKAINLWTAVHWALEAWGEITPAVIKRCWHHARITVTQPDLDVLCSDNTSDDGYLQRAFDDLAQYYLGTTSSDLNTFINPLGENDEPDSEDEESEESDEDDL